MNNAEINEALGAINENYPVWKAVMAMLQQEVDSCTLDVSNAGLPDHVRHYEAGRLSHSLEVRDSFQERMRAVKAGTAQGAGEAP